MYKNELRPFMAWLKTVGYKNPTVREATTLLPHWREGVRDGLY